MNRRSILAAISACVSLLVTSVHAQPVATPPVELKALAPLAGRFKIESHNKPNIRTKEGYIAKGESIGKWVHGGFFLRVEGHIESKEAGRVEWTEMYTYDRRLRQYKRFTFSSDGLAAISVGSLSETTGTIAWTVPDAPPGWAIEGAMKLEKEKIIYTLSVKNDKGETVRDLVATSTRQAEAGD